MIDAAGEMWGRLQLLSGAVADGAGQRKLNQIR